VFGIFSLVSLRSRKIIPALGLVPTETKPENGRTLFIGQVIGRVVDERPKSSDFIGNFDLDIEGL